MLRSASFERRRATRGPAPPTRSTSATRSRALLRAWVRAGGQLQPDASATADVFAQTIRFGQRRGDIRPDIDAEAAGRVLLDGYAGAIIRWSSEHDATDDGLRDAVAAALDVVLAGIQSRTAAS